MSNQVWNGTAEDLVGDLPDGINCVLTDPPYGVDFESNFATNATAVKKYNQKIANDADPEEALASFMHTMHLLIPKLADEAEVYIFTAWQVFSEWEAALRTLPDLELKNVLIWEKGWPGMGDLETNWGCGYEMIFYMKKGRRPVPERRRGVITINRLANGKNIHPTEKPVQLLEILLKMSTDEGDLVVDPYAGSGSAIWAAQRLGRLGIGIEKDEDYASDANERLEQSGFSFEY